MDRCIERLDNSNMSARPSSPSLRLPAYALYGEPAALAVDPLHCESIAARSRLHDWEIRPHRHENLFQLLVLSCGHAEAALDGRAVALAGPALLTVPPLAAHGFRFAPDVEGWVYTIAERHLQALLRQAPELHAALHRLHAWPLQPDAATTTAVLGAAAALREEVQSQAPWRAAALDAALLRLAVAVARAVPAEAALAGAVPERALAHVQRCRALVEALYREQPSLAALAAQLGFTPTQLNRVCQRVLGHPALGVLHDRLLLEAQRDLAYTTMSVKQVALGLGFCDAAYFTRFFQRRAGCTPTAWRQTHAGASAGS